MDEIESQRPRLFGIAYRMLGSIADAEDVVQNAYLRLEEHRNDEIHNVGGWLTTVTTRLAIDRARVLSRARETYVGEWLPEPIVQEANDPAAETTRADDLAIGFLHVLERLRPEERTALLLHDVFDYSFDEIAGVLGKRTDAVRQLASRARTRVREERPRLSVDRAKAAQVIERFLQALQHANLNELQAVLAEDVVSISDGGGKVNAARNPVEGLDAVSRLLMGVYEKYWSHCGQERLTVNGMPGLGITLEGKLVGVVSFDFAEDRIRSIYTVLNPDKLPH
ncbi:MAG TPA: RNA polymerase sigma-70 factor [Candidatus Baltobacteraceae bacterium]|nr:RNA polymerase sigma-70 factor [Candidatus Baltobacteraceae bacterium]